MEKGIAQKRLFLIGAAKCGTTTVDQMLRQHSNVYMSPIKEPNYFSTDIRPEEFVPLYKQQSLHDLDAYFLQSPLPELHLDFVRKEEQYNQLFEGATNEMWLGESSTSYLWSKEAPTNLQKQYPNAVFIVCLREPVDRLKSHLKMALQMGNIDSISDEIIEQDRTAEHQGWGISELFTSLGFYGEQLERWLQVFPKERFHFIFFEDLVSRQAETWEKLCDFLDLPAEALGDDLHANAGGIPRFPKLNAMLKGSARLQKLKEALPEGLIQRIKNKWNDTSAEVEIDESRWKSLYKADVERVESLLDLYLPHWK